MNRIKKSILRILTVISVTITNILLMSGFAEAGQAVPTGDQSPMIWVFVVLGCAVVALIIILLIRRKK